MIVQEPVQATIWFTLNHYSYSDAIFLAERLYAEVPSEDALFLLATTYYRGGKAVSAYSILSKKGFKSAQCRLLLAKCCVDLKKYGEAEDSLLGNSVQNESKIITSKTNIDDILDQFGESSSFAAQLLAFICSKTERYAKAIEYYKKSLKLNPFLWSSFESLIQLGAKPDFANIFSVSNINFNSCHGSNPLINLWNNCSRVSEKGGIHSQPVIGKEQNPPTFDKFDIHSPFAVIKSAIEPGSIDIITPENNMWVTKTCFAPQKIGLSGKNSGIATTTNSADVVLSPKTSIKIDTPATRHIFGVFPLGETPVSSTVSNHTIEEIEPKSIENTRKLVRAPMKKPQTRRSQQQQQQTIQTLAQQPVRSAAQKLQIFSQSTNINNQTMDCGLTTLQSSTNQSVVQPPLGLRRSSRLFNSSSSVKENSKATSRNTNQENNKTATSAKTPTKKTRRQTNTSTSITSSSAVQKESELNEINKPEWSNSSSEELYQAGLKMQKSSAEGLLNLLTEIGKAVYYFGQFQSQKAIDALTNLPEKHFNTGWVLTAVGRAYFEMGKYEEAVKYFENARQCEPHRLLGTEYFSTALWHLQSEVKLSMLSQELIEFDKNSPQTWCVAGNCFSLQKEHETAIKFLQRAIQVDPDFAYAYTLLGHELVLTEEMENALACFRNAIRIDPRHYNAWYGIGMIYYKQEKYQLAELHYRKALQISPCSPVLMCHIGVVQHSLKKSEQALQTFNKALEMDKKNALCKFHRASIYFAMDKHQLALTELEELKQIVPKESLVYFLIGKVHKRIGNTHLALMNFSWAMDLDPKGANNQIKEVIDKQYVNDDDDEVVVCLDEATQSSQFLPETPNHLHRRTHHHESTSSMEAEEVDDNDDDDPVDEAI